MKKIFKKGNQFVAVEDSPTIQITVTGASEHDANTLTDQEFQEIKDSPEETEEILQNLDQITILDVI